MNTNPFYKPDTITEAATTILENRDIKGFFATSEKSQFGGHRPKIVDKSGKIVYLSQASYNKPDEAKKHAEEYLKQYAKGVSSYNMKLPIKGTYVKEAVITDYKKFSDQHKKMYPKHTEAQIKAAWEKYSAAFNKKEETLEESHFVSKGIYTLDGKKIQGARSSKLFLQALDTNGFLHNLSWKEWTQLKLNDTSSDFAKKQFIDRLAKQIKMFNKRVDLNMWIKKADRSFEDTVDYIFKLDPNIKYPKATGLKEETLEESHFNLGDSVTCIKSGMTGKIVKIEKPEVGKYYHVKREDGKIMKYAPSELEAMDEETIEESSMKAFKIIGDINALSEDEYVAFIIQLGKESLRSSNETDIPEHSRALKSFSTALSNYAKHMNMFFKKYA